MAIKPYKSYNFIDKDPVIDRVRTAWDDARALDPRLTLQALSDRSGVSKSAIYNWLEGKTKRPQVASTTAVLRVCGCDLAVVTPNGEVISLTRHHLPAAASNIVRFAVVKSNIRAKADVHVKKKAAEGERHGSQNTG